MTRKKIFFIAISICFALFFLTVCGIRLWLGTQSAQQRILAKINHAIPGSISWEKLEFSLLTGHIDLQKPAVAGTLDEKIIEAERIRLNLSLPSLLAKNIRAESLILEKPQVRMKTDAQGHLNLVTAFSDPQKPKAEPSSGKGMPFNILAEEIQIKEGFFSYEKPGKTPESPAEHVIVRDIDLKLEKGDFADRTGKAELKIGGGDADIAGLKTVFREFSLKTDLEKGNFRDTDLKLDSDLARLSVSGSVSDTFSRPVPDMELHLEANLENIRQSLSLAADLSGPVQLRLKARGNPGDPEAELDLNYGGGNLAGIRVENLAGTCRVKNRILHISKLDIRAFGGNVQAEGQADFAKAFPQGFFSAQREMNALNYSFSVKPAGMALDQLPIQKTGLDGTLDGLIRVQGSGISAEHLQLSADTDLTAQNLSVEKVLNPADVHLTAQALVEKGKVTFRSLDVNADALHLSGNGDYTSDSKEIQAKLKLDASDLNAVFSRVNIKDVTGKLNLLADISGTLVQPLAEVEIKGEGLGFQDIRIGNLQSKAGLAPDGTVQIPEFALDNQDSKLSASGKIRIFEKGLRVHPDLPADILLTLHNVKAGNFMAKETLKGSADGTIRIQGPVRKPAADAELTGKNLAFASRRIGDLNARVHFAKGKADIEHLKLQNRQSDLKLSGTLQILDENMKPLSDPGFDLHLASSAFFPQDFTDQIKGRLSFTAQGKGSLNSPEILLSLEGKDLAAGKNRIGSLNTELAFARGLVTVKNLSLENRKSGISISGTARVTDPQSLKPLDDPEFDLNISKAIVFPEDFTDGLKGKLRISGHAKGKKSDPRAELSVDGENLAAPSGRIGNLRAALRFADGKLLMDKMQVRNGKSALDLSGSAAVLNPKTNTVLADPEVDIKMAGDSLFLEDFIKGMKGKLALSGHVSGTKNRPKGSITVEGKKIDLGMQRIEGMQLNSRLDGERVNIDSFLVAMAPGEKIVTDGWVSPLRRNYDLRMKSDGISLKNIDSLSHRDLGKGKISFQIAGKGSFDNPNAQGDIKIEGMTLKKKVLDDLKIRVDIADQTAKITGNVHFDLDALYHLNSKAFTAKLVFDRTELAPFFSLAGRDDLKGSVTGIIEASGNAGKPEEMRAVADIGALEIFLKDAELLRTSNAKILFENSQLSVPGIQISLLREGNLNLAGKGNSKGPLDFRADGEIPLRVFALFNEELEDLSGSLRVKADIKGSPQKPDFQANIALNSLGMTVPGLMQKLHDLNGNIELSSKALVLKNIAGKLDEGSFDLGGTIALDNFRPGRVQLELRGSRLPVSVPDTADILFNTHLTLKGTQEKSLLEGEMILLEGEYYKDVKLGLLETLGKIGQKKRSESASGSGTVHPFAKNMRMNVTVRARNPFVVDNNMALLTLKPDLKVHGTPAVPLIGGRAEVESGTIIYQTREFEIEKGVIDFLNPYKIEPTFDIKGDAEIRDWTVHLAVSGTPDNLKFELSSDPQEEHGDILSLLVFGKTGKELVSGDGSSTSATQLIADMVAEKMGEKLRDATALDTLELGYTEGNGTQDSQIKVTVGKELSRRMRVKYGVETRSGETVQTIATEYKFLENLIVNAFQDTSGVYGGEIIFRLEFR
ncbi:MAG: translocation/assembly module TamB domain-containing protein [Desulfobacterales bacterium]